MKKIFLSIMCASALLVGALATNPLTALAANQTANCEYGTPIVDGVEDIFWKNIEFTTGGKAVDGSSETTIAFKTAWDETNFYYYLEVYDTTVNLTASGGADFWRVDGIDLQFDFVNEGREGSADVSIYEGLRGYFSLNRGGSIGGAQGGLGSCGIGMNAYVNELPDGAGYVCEGSFPWPAGATIEADKVIAMDIQINDNTSGVTRDAIICWSSPDFMGFQRSNGYGNVTLVNNNIFTEEAIQDATDGAPEGKEPTAVGTNGATLNWNAMDGAGIYKVNLFRVLDDENELVQTLEISDGSLSYRVSELDIERDYIYQVTAYNEDGKVLAIYPAVSFKTVEIGGSSSEETEQPGESETNVPSGDETEVVDTNSENNNNQGKVNNPAPWGLIIGIIVVVVVVIVVVVVLKKKKKE